MENTPPSLPLDYKIRVLSAEAEGGLLRAVVEARGMRYQVVYIRPREAPLLKKNDYLSVVTPAMMMMVDRLNDQHEPEGELYGLYEWQPLTGSCA